MTDPKENESEELSTDELKSFSGGSMHQGAMNSVWAKDEAGNFTERVTAQGSGSGMTKDDYRKANRLITPTDNTDPGTINA